MRKSLAVLIVFFSLFSCKSTKVGVGDIDYLPARVIVKKNREATFEQKRVSATMAIKYKGKEDLPNISATLRIVKDSIIWVNFSKLGFPVAKLMITPDAVQFYEKINKTSFEGNFELISTLLGADFDFFKVQNIFLGESLLTLEKEHFDVNVQENLYGLLPRKRNQVLDIYYWINPQHFKIAKEEVRHASKRQNLTILYKDFDKINESLFPKGFLITATDERRETVIDVSYRNVEFDVPLRFPFKIPVGYRNIELE